MRIFLLDFKAVLQLFSMAFSASRHDDKRQADIGIRIAGTLPNLDYFTFDRFPIGACRYHHRRFRGDRIEQN
jgi:hypothetical protein